MALRVLVCGGLMYMDRARIFSTLDQLHREPGIEIVLHGGASGADLLCLAWADANAVPAIAFQTNWSRDGRLATEKRNQRMLAEGRPHLLVAFPGGKGTAELVRMAQEAQLQVIAIDPA